MDNTKLCLLFIIMIIMVSVLKNEVPGIALALKLITCIYAGTIVINRITDLYLEYNKVFGMLHQYSVYITLFVKAVCICYIFEFVSNMAKEEGLLNLSMQVEVLGKISILMLGLPVLNMLIEYLQAFLEK